MHVYIQEKMEPRWLSSNITQWQSIGYQHKLNHMLIIVTITRVYVSTFKWIYSAQQQYIVIATTLCFLKWDSDALCKLAMHPKHIPVTLLHFTD